MLEQALIEAFEACRTALEEPQSNIGPFENAVDKLKTAQGQVQSKGDQGIFINNLQYTTNDGQQINIPNVRAKLSELSLQIHSSKQEHIKEEKQSLENKKSNQMKAKQNLRSEQIPDLYVTEYKNNIVEWMSIVLRQRDHEMGFQT